MAVFLTEEESTAFKNYRHISLSWNSGGLSTKSREHRLSVLLTETKKNLFKKTAYYYWDGMMAVF